MSAVPSLSAASVVRPRQPRGPYLLAFVPFAALLSRLPDLSLRAEAGDCQPRRSDSSFLASTRAASPGTLPTSREETLPLIRFPF